MDTKHTYTASSLSLRPARNSDSNFLLMLANDTIVRTHSFSQKPIFSNEHEAWFAQKMNDPHCLIFIAQANGEEVGQIRLDADGTYGIITFSVIPSARRHGYGTAMLIRLITLCECTCAPTKGMEHIAVTTLIGRVKRENIASQKAFIKAGFIPYEQNDIYEYRYIINKR